MKKIVALGLSLLATASFASPLAISKVDLGVGVSAVISPGPFKVAASSHDIKYSRSGNTLYVEVPSNTKHIGWWHSLFHKRNIVQHTVSIHIPKLRAINLAPSTQLHVRSFAINNFDLRSGSNRLTVLADSKMKLSYTYRGVSADFEGGRISKLDFSGNTSVIANNFKSDNLEFNSGAGTRLFVKAKNLSVNTLDWGHAKAKLDIKTGNIDRISAYGAANVSTANLNVNDFYVDGTAGRVVLKGSGFNLQKLTVARNAINLSIKQGGLKSLFTSGSAKVTLNNVQYKKHALEVKHSGVAKLNLYGDGFVPQLVSSNRGISMNLQHGQLSKVLMSGKVNFVAIDMHSKTLLANNRRDSLRVAGIYHINKLAADNKRINLFLAKNAVLTQMHVKNDAAVFGPGLRAQRGMQVSSIANGRVVLAGNVTVSEYKDSGGRTVVTLSDGTLKKLMVRGRVIIVGKDIVSNDLELNVKSHASVNLKGQIGLKSLAADNSGLINVQLALAKQLRIVATGASNIELVGTANAVQAQLSGNAVLNAPYMRVTNAMIRTKNNARADVWVSGALRAFAYNGSNIYYYITPDQLTRDPNQHGNVLRVYSKLARQLMFHQASQGFGDQM